MKLIDKWPRLNSVHTAGKDSPILLVGTHVEDEKCTEEYLAAMKQR